MSRKARRGYFPESDDERQVLADGVKAVLAAATAKTAGLAPDQLAVATVSVLVNALASYAGGAMSAGLLPPSYFSATIPPLIVAALRQEAARAEAMRGPAAGRA